jgi:hypothetical protein
MTFTNSLTLSEIISIKQKSRLPIREAAFVLSCMATLQGGLA